MSTIRFDSVGFHYDSPYTPVFDRLDLALDTHWRTGLVGRNGRGKTTLLRLLRAELEPVRGALHVPVSCVSFPSAVPAAASAGASTLEVVREGIAPFAEWERRMRDLLPSVESGDDAALHEYAALGERFEEMGGYTIDDRVEREIVRMGMDPEILARPFATLSGGEQTRALIAPLFLRAQVGGGAFPLIDEPTNHLDARGRELLGGYLAGKSGFLLVSHDRHLLDLCIDHVVAIEKGEVRVIAGSYTGWSRQRDRERESERRRRARIEREVRSLERAARERRAWAGRREREKRGADDKGFIGARAARQMKRALAAERRVDTRLAEKKRLLRNVEKERELKLTTEPGGPETVLAADGLGMDLGDRTVVRDLSLRVRRGDRVAVTGPNGCGKTTLLRIVAGELDPTRGRLERPTHLDVAFAHQTPRWQTGSLREHLRAAAIDESHFRGVMGVLGVEGQVFDRPLETFSEGQRKKVDLCRSFLRPYHLLVWDEPLNYLDIASREQIEAVVLDAAPTLLFTEHDHRFTTRIATHHLPLQAGTLLKR